MLVVHRLRVVVSLRDSGRHGNLVLRDLETIRAMVESVLPVELLQEFLKDPYLDDFNSLKPPTCLGIVDGCLWKVAPRALVAGYVLTLSCPEKRGWIIKEAVRVEQKFPALQQLAERDCRIYAILSGPKAVVAYERQLRNWYTGHHWSYGLSRLR